MSLIHLDANFLIRALVPQTREAAAFQEWLMRRESMAISCPAWAEFLCGPVSQEAVDVVATLIDRMPFTAREAGVAAMLFDETGRRRGTLVDCMIAATAIENGASLATSNAADFKRLAAHGLTLFEG